MSRPTAQLDRERALLALAAGPQRFVPEACDVVALVDFLDDDTDEPEAAEDAGQ